jgi:hypothetical protein
MALRNLTRDIIHISADENGNIFVGFSFEILFV